MANTRNIALNVLLKIENEGAYSNIALNNAIKENRLSGVDSSFVSALVYGVPVLNYEFFETVHI